MDIHIIDQEFESPYELLSSANEDYRCFYKLLVQEMNSFRLDYVKDQEVFDACIVHRVSIFGSPSIKLRKLAYNIVNDCKNALDQSTFIATKILDGKEPSKVHTYFPFSTNKEDYETLFDKRKGRCRDISPPLKYFIAKFEPWWRDEGDKTGNNYLRTLSKLSGPNKHQVIIDFSFSLTGKEVIVAPIGNFSFFSAPPRRLTREEKLGWLGQIPEVYGRTDYIGAVSDLNSLYNIDAKYSYSLTAPAATRINQNGIDYILSKFIEESNRCVEGVKAFIVSQIIA